MDDQHQLAAAPDTEFTRLMRRVAEGSQEAVRELYKRYAPHIRRVVRHKLHPRLRSQFDSVDFTQDVWASFFAHELQKTTFESPEALMRFLATMTCHKVVDAFRQRLMTIKHDLDREHSLDSSTIQKEGGPIASDPGPSQVAEAQDEWHHFLRHQPGQWQRVLELWRYGFTPAEIAHEVGMHEKSVRRILGRWTKKVLR